MFEALSGIRALDYSGLGGHRGNRVRGVGDVSVTKTDTDSAGVTVSAISGNTTEAGGTATFAVTLNSQPTQDLDQPIAG
jgi:hypothetical protein